MGVGAYLLTMLAISGIASVVHAYVATVLWAWFVVPAFNVPMLTMHAAYGINVLIGYAVFNVSSVKWDEDETDKTRAAKAGRIAFALFSLPVITLAGAFVANKLLIGL